VTRFLEFAQSEAQQNAALHPDVDVPFALEFLSGSHSPCRQRIAELQERVPRVLARVRVELRHAGKAFDGFLQRLHEGSKYNRLPAAYGNVSFCIQSTCMSQTLLQRPLLLVAHQDDEALGCGILLQRAEHAVVVFATDGAPADEYFWRQYGSRERLAE